MRIHSVDERRGVVKMERSRSCDAFSAENGHCQLMPEPTLSAGWKEVCGWINVNHRHSKTVQTRTRFDIYVNRGKTGSEGSGNDTQFHALMDSEGQSDR